MKKRFSFLQPCCAVAPHWMRKNSHPEVWTTALQAIACPLLRERWPILKKQSAWMRPSPRGQRTETRRSRQSGPMWMPLVQASKSAVSCARCARATSRALWSACNRSSVYLPTSLSLSRNALVTNARYGHRSGCAVWRWCYMNQCDCNLGYRKNNIENQLFN